MIDQIHLKPSCTFLTPEAVQLTSTRHGFGRCANITGKQSGGTVVLKFKVDRYAFVRIVAIKLSDGRWWVKCIEANMPSLIRGHNGTPLANLHELHLALTRLRHIVALVTTSACHGRIIPGVGAGNDGWIGRVECLIQFDDRDRRFLVGSHFARLKHQQQPTGVYFRQSSYFTTRELVLSIYDKLVKVRAGVAEPVGVEPTRVEARILDECRLAKDVKRTKLFTGASGPLVATLSPVTAHALVQLSLSRLSGFGWLPEVDSLQGLPKAARLIAASLGQLIHQPHHLDLALENYQLVENPGKRIMQSVESKLRAYAFRNYVGDPRHIIFPDLSELARAHVRWPEREKEFEVLMRDIGAPMEPEPDIVAAWSRTTFLPAVPATGALFGSVSPAPPPFRTSTL